MSTIREKFLLVSNFEQSQTKIMNDCINNTSDVILDANRSQLLEGLDKQGQKITPKYKPFTRQRKIEENRDPDKVTLFDKGDFHRSMFMEAKGNYIFIDAKDEKTDELMTKYDRGGEMIFGIPQKKKTDINESIMDKFINIFRLMTKL